MRIKKKGTPGNKTEKKSIVRGRKSKRLSERKAAEKRGGNTRTRKKASSPPPSNPPPARVDMPLSTLKEPQEGQASPTIKRKFDINSSQDTKKPSKSVKTKSLKHL